MAEIKKISTELQPLDKLLDTSGDAGTSGQVLTSTGTGINWVSGDSLPGGPYLPLTAGGTKPLTGDLYINSSLYFGGANERIYMNGGGATDWRGVEVDSSGLWSWGETGTGNYFSKDVGIGTTSPNGKLTILEVQAANKGDFDFQQIVYNGGWSANVDGLAAIQWSDGIGSSNTIGRIGVTYTGSQGEFQIKDLYNGGYAGSGKVFAVRGDGRAYFTGNVGIGTTSPDNRLDVVASDVNITPNAESSAVFRRNGNNYLTILSNASNEGGILFGNAVDDNDGSVSYKHNTQSMQFATADVERMRIDSSGDVGIGNTGPAHKLDVTGDIYSSGQMLTKGSSMACFTVLGDLDTGLGNFDGKGRVSLVSDNKAEITVDKGTIAFDNYTATAVATTGSLIPNQGNQAVTEDTLALLAVDPDGNVVRGSQEGTWTFTKAQLDALATTTSGGTQLIQAPGANKAVIVEESNWMIKYSGTGSMSQNGFEIRQSTVVLADAGISRIPSGQINNIMSSAQGTPTNPSYGFYSRDLPQYNNDGRTYKTNAQTVLMRINTNATPANLVSISIKLKYRLFDAATF